MKTIQEQIEVMQHYANGGEVEFYDKTHDNWIKKDINSFNWIDRDYRIKEQKKSITIEKWLCFYNGGYIILEICENWSTICKRIKLLETYEVEL